MKKRKKKKKYFYDTKFINYYGEIVEDKKCLPHQVKLRCLSCGKVFCRTTPLYTCPICGGMVM